MLVFKFGGASVKEADAVQNLAGILRKFNDKVVIVVSAMGKTTNALENISLIYFSGQRRELDLAVSRLKGFHLDIMNGLFHEKHRVYDEVNQLFEMLQAKLDETPSLNFDFDYDQIICYGELLSTRIVSAWLNESGIKTVWRDIRKSLITDDHYREGNVRWDLTRDLVKHDFGFNDNQLFITQGFIASTVNNLTTTLGREGSDYTAAILANILEAEKLIIWKDVPGVLNADPKWFDETVLLENISYTDAIELAYYGASVIHPKTIQPLKAKNIPLFVRSFIHPELPGTRIGESHYETLIPSFIFKMDQLLISISAKDLSFIAEENLELILGSCARYGLKINLMQNSAVSFQICVNNDPIRIDRIKDELVKHFSIKLEGGLELVTIRYYDETTIRRVTVDKEVILEQHNRHTAQMVMRQALPR